RRLWGEREGSSGLSSSLRLGGSGVGAADWRRRWADSRRPAADFTSREVGLARPAACGLARMRAPVRARHLRLRGAAHLAGRRRGATIARMSLLALSQALAERRLSRRQATLATLWPTEAAPRL